jgi:hypothetical protein
MLFMKLSTVAADTGASTEALEADACSGLAEWESFTCVCAKPEHTSRDNTIANELIAVTFIIYSFKSRIAPQ